MMQKQTYKFCYGISSKTSDNQHVFMADFDGVNLNTVIHYMRRLQMDYNLSDIYIIESKNGFNCISLDKLTLNLIYSIGNNMEKADPNFYKYGFERGYYVLRFDKDKKLTDILKNPSCKYNKSLAHTLFLRFFFNGLKIQTDFTFDNYTNFELIKYHSKKNGYHNEKK